MRVVTGTRKEKVAEAGGPGEGCQTAARDAPEGGPWIGEGWRDGWRTDGGGRGAAPPIGLVRARSHNLEMKNR
jgi:hypothetical protein